MASEGRFRIDVGTAQQALGLVVCDGKHIVEYDAREHKWTRYRKSAEADPPRLLNRNTPELQFLIARYAKSWVPDGTPYERFLQALWLADESTVDTGTVRGTRCVVLKAELRKSQGPMSLVYTVEIALDDKTWLPVREVTAARMVGAGVSSDRSCYTFQYDQVTSDPKLGGDEFTFALPERASFVPAETLPAPSSPLVGQDLSTWNELQGLDGGSIPLVLDRREDPTLIVLWATWCMPCRAELAALRTLQEEAEFAKLRIIAVSVDRDAAGLNRYLASSPVPFIVARDLDFAGRLGLPHVPTSLVLDRKGVVTFVRTGWGGDADVEGLRNALRRASGAAGAKP